MAEGEVVDIKAVPDAPKKVVLLTAKQILEAEDIRTVDVDVPEWGGPVRLRALSGDEAIDFVAAIEASKTDKGTAAIRVVVLCAVDEDGKRLFTEEALMPLKSKSLRALLRLQVAAMELNGLTQEAQEAAKTD